MKLRNSFFLTVLLCLFFPTAQNVRILDPEIIHYLKRRAPYHEMETKRTYLRDPYHQSAPGSIMESGVDCDSNKVGSFGDPSQECRVFHVCQLDGRRDSFFCPAATRFNDQLQLCDWKQKVNARCNAGYGTAYIQSTMVNPVLNHESEREYRNKYQEQEYYHSVYHQPEPKLRYIVQSPNEFFQSKRTLMYVPQPIFAYLQPSETVLGAGRGTLAEDEGSFQVDQKAEGRSILPNQQPQSTIVSDVLEERPVAELSPVTADVILSNDKPANEAAVEVVDNHSGGFEINPVIELWLPAKVVKMA